MQLPTVLHLSRSRKSFQAFFLLLEFHTYLCSFSCTSLLQVSRCSSVLLCFFFFFWFGSRTRCFTRNFNETLSFVSLLISICTSFKEGSAVNRASNVQFLDWKLVRSVAFHWASGVLGVTSSVWDRTLCLGGLPTCVDLFPFPQWI